MYEIRPETVKTFINDRNIKLPRFQRKQTWDEKKNFQLCISLFKEYPIGVSILSVDTNRDRTIRWLLDGRQRKNALTQIFEDPENIYIWGKKFIGFKNSDQLFDVEEKFWRKINDYIEEDPIETSETDMNASEEELNDNSESTEDTTYEESGDYQKTGLNLLLEILKIIHNKTPKCTGFTKPFDFIKDVKKLPYIESHEGNTRLSSRRLKTFIDEYRRYCDVEDLFYESHDSFNKFIHHRCEVVDKTKFQANLKKNWDAILERIQIVDRIDNMLMNSKIGIIEVKNLLPSDSQKIFNIINSEGEKLTAVEILSAKPSWNYRIETPTQAMTESVSNLYKRIGTVNSDIVKWDLPATLVKRIGSNYVIKNFTESKTDFEKEITTGFKILSGIYENGVKKEDIESLSKNNQVNWSTDIETKIFEIQQLLKLIGGHDYFKYFASWKTSIMELTSDAIALNFISIMYKDWERKGKPIGNDLKVKQLQKNAFILLDRSIYEYVTRQWRGSSDSKIANNILSLNNESSVFTPLPTDKWEKLLNEIFESCSIDGVDISSNLMEPLLYHFYAIKCIQGPDSNYEIEIDHIIPQYMFEQSTLVRKDVIKESLLNLGLLPKNENISKGKKRLIEINQEWLKDQIVKYEFIEKDKFEIYSNINNLDEFFNNRKHLFTNAFGEKRNDILNN